MAAIEDCLPHHLKPSIVLRTCQPSHVDHVDTGLQRCHHLPPSSTRLQRSVSHHYSAHEMLILLLSLLLFHFNDRVLVLLLLDETLPLDPGGVHIQGSNDAVATEKKVSIPINHILPQPLVLSYVLFYC